MEKTVGDQNKCEAVFYNDDALLDSNLEGAVRDGYVAAAMAEIEGIRVLKNPEFSDLKADVGITEMVIVNNSGIMGLALSADYNLNEKITDNVKIISFQEAMDSFVEVTDENVDKTLIKNQTGDLNFNYVDLCYFPVSTSDSKDDVTFLPVWVLEARDKSRSPILRVLINATDGSFVGAYY